MKKSQKKRIRKYLEAGHTLTQGEANKMFGCGRLSGRILEIRDDLFDEGGESYIETEMIPVIGFDGDIKRIARYSIWDY